MLNGIHRWRPSTWQARFLSSTRHAASAPPANVPLTSTRYTHLQRDPRFKQLDKDDVAYLRSVCPTIIATSDPKHDDILPYNVDWMHKYRGASTLVLRPKSTDHVSAILKYCNAKSLAVVPQGGNTGLVGGAVPVFDEIILNLGSMSSIRSFDPVSGVLVADAGCILEKLDDYLHDREHMMPLDLGAKGSCQIGGNVATNAGGLRLLRYGSLHGTVLGLETVLADGTVLHNLSALRKDNTGTDLKHLFIGSEGTLGVITGVSILTPVRPNAVHVATMAVPNYAAVQAAFLRARRDLGEILSAFEFWDAGSSNLVAEHLPHIRNPLPGAPFQVLVETHGSNSEHDTAKLDAYLERLFEDSVAVDGTVAQDTAQAAQIWGVREGIPEACARAGAVYKYDLSVPVPALYSLVERTADRLKGVADVTSVIGYGHVGDGNLHLNVAARDYTPEVTSALEPWIYELTAQHKGSISAEHGIGVMKPKYLKYSKDPASIELMRRAKQMLDPKGILNPYKFLPSPQ